MADVKTVLAAAMAWLYDTDQPGGAIMQHHGPGGFRLGDRYYDLTPTGAENLPVISVTVAGAEFKPGCWRGFGGEYSDSFHAKSVLVPRGPCEEFLGVVSLAAELGAEVRETWNGAISHTSGSIGLAAPARPSLVAAMSRYQAGCPVHGTVFCGWQGSTDEERACTWYADGRRLVVPPAWPVAEEAARG